jgi:hypothetical protein
MKNAVAVPQFSPYFGGFDFGEHSPAAKIQLFNHSYELNAHGLLDTMNFSKIPAK